MKGVTLAALGDIHSNHAALEACLEAAEAAGASVFLFMGDYVSDCACPQKTMRLLRECADKYDCRFIRGNREQYLLDYRAHGGDWRRGTGGGSLLYTYNRLTEADFAFFESLPAVRREAFPGLPALLLCHGAPDDLRGRAAEQPDEARRWLDEADAAVLLCAHTHRPCLTPLPRGLAVNVGSVGLPDTPGEAQFALLRGEKGGWHAEIARARFDVERTVAEFTEDGFLDAAGLWPAMIEKQLREGGEQGMLFVQRAYDLWTGKGPVPEAVWQQAARETGIVGNGH